MATVRQEAELITILETKSEYYDINYFRPKYCYIGVYFFYVYESLNLRCARSSDDDFVSGKGTKKNFIFAIL